MLAIIKQLHLLSIALSFGGFLVRGFWMLTESPRLQKKVVKVFPHIVDTLLLITGITLVIMSGFSFADPWLLTKIGLLIVYIVFGTLALKRGKTKSIRSVFLVLSILTFVWIYFVARTHNPLPFM